MPTTKHTHGPNFGRRVPGCPRCTELAAGARPIEWSTTRKAREYAEFRRALAAHDCKARGCGPVCTAFDW